MTALAEAPTLEMPRVTDVPPHPDPRMLETVHGLQVMAVRLAEERAALATRVAGHEAVIDRRNAELAAMALRVVQAEADRDALLASCFARQTALADPSVRERQLEALIVEYRDYARFLEAENDRLRSLHDVPAADTVQVRPAGRRRRPR